LNMWWNQTTFNTPNAHVHPLGFVKPFVVICANVNPNYILWKYGFQITILSSEYNTSLIVQKLEHSHQIWQQTSRHFTSLIVKTKSYDFFLINCKLTCPLVLQEKTCVKRKRNQYNLHIESTLWGPKKQWSIVKNLHVS
jgi:hypothetical protein